MVQLDPTFLDDVPGGDEVTAYDRAHMALYLRLFDAAQEGADWREVVEVLFGLDPRAEPERCQHVYDSHLARASWMARQGFRDLGGSDR